MLDIRNRHTAAREKVLGEGIREVVSELRLVDVVDYVAFLRLEQFGNIADIVSSSSELHLKPGALRFGESGEVHLGWDSAPTVTLDMTFRYEPVTAHFRLELAAASALVDIVYMEFDGVGTDEDGGTALLRQALRSARLKPENYFAGPMLLQ